MRKKDILRHTNIDFGILFNIFINKNDYFHRKKTILLGNGIVILHMITKHIGFKIPFIFKRPEKYTASALQG